MFQLSSAYTAMTRAEFLAVKSLSSVDAARARRISASPSPSVSAATKIDAPPG